MKVHILRPDSITPIARYLQAARLAPASYEIQKSLAALLLYREREYQSMYASRWTGVGGPLPSVDPFVPHSATADAEIACRERLGVGPHRTPLDVFGLKAQVGAALRSTLRPVRAHAVGWLLLSRLLEDILQPAPAMHAARRAIDAGETLQGLALLWSAAITDSRAGQRHPSQAVARRTESEARRALRVAGRSPRDFPARILEAFDERVRRIALTARVREEGESFTRFWTTERRFCAAERAAALEGFDERDVPLELRPLAPLARRFGVGDDVCRRLFLRELPRAGRAAVATALKNQAAAIQHWLDSVPGPPYSPVWACFFWLLEAAEEIE